MSATLEEGEIELPASNVSSVQNRKQLTRKKNQKRNARRKELKARHVAKATADKELALEYRKLAKAERKSPGGRMRQVPIRHEVAHKH